MAIVYPNPYKFLFDQGFPHQAVLTNGFNTSASGSTPKFRKSEWTPSSFRVTIEEHNALQDNQTILMFRIDNEHYLEYIRKGPKKGGYRYHFINASHEATYTGSENRDWSGSWYPVGGFDFFIFLNEGYIGDCMYYSDRDDVTVTTYLQPYHLQEDLGSHVLTEDPYQLAEESEPAGGYGDFDYTSDIIPLPNAPTISVTECGFITLYKPSLQQLKDLAAYMWTGLFDLSNFRKIFADPMDCIISLALMPVSPTASTSQELKVGNIGTGLQVSKLPNQFVEVNFAPLNIGLRTKSFMDYSPYTKLQIYLPFIGTRSISIDDIAGRPVTLKYIIDLFTGACNAAIGVEVETILNGQKVKRTTTLYQFTGNVLADVPITATNFATFLQATIGAVTTAVGVATGAGAMSGVASAINSASSMKPDVEKSGNLASTAGFLGVQKPYLILTYPRLCKPDGRDKVAGTPSFIGLSNNKKLSSFHGFTQLHKINVKGITCTEAERQMIYSQLTGEGVIMP